jgi:hypothetical protein
LGSEAISVTQPLGDANDPAALPQGEGSSRVPDRRLGLGYLKGEDGIAIPGPGAAMCKRRERRDSNRGFTHRGIEVRIG